MTSSITQYTYFNSAHECIDHYKKWHWTRKVLSLLKSFGTHLIYGVAHLYNYFSKANKKIDCFTKVPKLGFSQSRLIVCLHGLNSKPAQFIKILSKIESAGQDIYVPRIVEKGNAELDHLVKPLFQAIQKWASSGSDKELILIGISNGGRIARAIDAELGKLSSHHLKKVHLISIAGACKGSSLVNLVHKLGLSCLLSKPIAKEMAKNSERFKRLEREWQYRGNEIERKYTFFASPHDWQVPNFNSTLMEIEGYPSQYAIIPGHGHNSIVSAVADEVARIVNNA